MAVGGYVAYDRYQDNQKSEIAKLAEPAPKAAIAPKADAAKKIVEEKAGTPLIPSFDIVRVEKDGNILVAGQAEPGSDITLMNRDTIIGTAKTGDAGAFVVLPDNPLKGANNQISISSKLKDGTTINSQQRVAVAVPEQGEALVALVEPGKPVEILQKPRPTAEPKPVDVAKAPEVEPAVVPEAVAEPATVKEPKQEVVTQTQPASKPIVEAVTVIEKAKPKAEETVVAKIEAAPEGVKPEPIVDPKPLEKAREESKKRVARLLEGVSEEPKEELATVAEEVVAEAAIPPKTLVPEAPQPKPPIAATPSVEPAVEEPAVERVAAIVEEKKPEPAKVVEPSKTITVDAVEVENDTLFVAGKASPNETVRVYVDDQLVGDIKTGEGGQWLLQQTKPLGPGKYNIRVDLLKKGSAEVVARAAVPFAVEDLTPAELAEAKVGNVIIRKNDNLWTIAQRLYGDGRRYTSIYQQNKGQIKNPQLIFPGQIFKVPSEGQVAGASNTVDQAVAIAPAAKPDSQ